MSCTVLQSIHLHPGDSSLASPLILGEQRVHDTCRFRAFVGDHQNQFREREMLFSWRNFCFTQRLSQGSSSKVTWQNNRWSFINGVDVYIEIPNVCFNLFLVWKVAMLFYQQFHVGSSVRSPFWKILCQRNSTNPKCFGCSRGSQQHTLHLLVGQKSNVYPKEFSTWPFSSICSYHPFFALFKHSLLLQIIDGTFAKVIFVDLSDVCECKINKREGVMGGALDQSGD